jgi:hypothetical protein
MKSLIQHKKLLYFIATLHVSFLFMPVSYSGDIVLCFRDTGRIEIGLKLAEGCSTCKQSGDDLQKKDPCFCVDIPISKESDGPSALSNSKTVQPRLQISLQPDTTDLVKPSYRDGLFASVDRLLFKSTAQELLRTVILLI